MMGFMLALRDLHGVWADGNYSRPSDLRLVLNVSAGNAGRVAFLMNLSSAGGVRGTYLTVLVPGGCWGLAMRPFDQDLVVQAFAERYNSTEDCTLYNFALADGELRVLHLAKHPKGLLSSIWLRCGEAHVARGRFYIAWECTGFVSRVTGDVWGANMTEFNLTRHRKAVAEWTQVQALSLFARWWLWGSFVMEAIEYRRLGRISGVRLAFEALFDIWDMVGHIPDEVEEEEQMRRFLVRTSAFFIGMFVIAMVFAGSVSGSPLRLLMLAFAVGESGRWARVALQVVAATGPLFQIAEDIRGECLCRAGRRFGVGIAVVRVATRVWLALPLADAPCASHLGAYASWFVLLIVVELLHRRSMVSKGHRYRQICVEAADCSVCLGEMVVGEEIWRTPCAHCFHRECLERWMDEQLICPLCRADIPPAVAD